MRVGVLGGTFDPVHNGHLALADAARSELALDLVLFVPAGLPWRKSHRVITAATHRLAMLELSTKTDAAYGISDIELRREGPSYTANTLEALAGERLDDELYFIMGADALADLPNWHEPKRIVQHAILAVARRGTEQVPTPIVVPRDRIVYFEMKPVEVSSTEIRRRVAAGEEILSLVPPEVAKYILDHGLYRTTP